MVVPLYPYKNRVVAVVGLGLSGESVVRSLLEGGAAVMAWDDNPKACERLQSLNLAGDIVINPPEEWEWQNLYCLVPAPGVPLTHPVPHRAIKMAMEHGCRITGELELLRETLPEAFIIGITGTNGKSTTTALIGHILQHAGIKAEVGGNLGTPMLALEEQSGNDAPYVLELSSYQLDLTQGNRTRVNIAVMLNISADHIERHGDMAGYITAKRKIFAGQRKGDTAIISVDDSNCAKIYEDMKRVERNLIAISVDREVTGGVFVKDGILYDAISGATEEKTDLSTIANLQGRHNWQNAAAAYAVCRTYGMAAEDILSNMRSFSGLHHRMQRVEVIGNVAFVNDSKATNAEATAQALDTFRNIHWIVGGREKEEGIRPLEKYFSHIAHAYLIGEAEEKFAEALEGKVEYTRCGTLDRAFAAASRSALADKRGDAVVLLSPACSSFDQWQNFEQRGDAFCKAVAKLDKST